MTLIIVGVTFLVIASVTGRKNYLNDLQAKRTRHAINRNTLTLYMWVLNVQSIAQLTKPSYQAKSAKSNRILLEHARWDLRMHLAEEGVRLREAGRLAR